MRRILLCAAVLAVAVWMQPRVEGATEVTTGVWSVDTTKLDLPALERLEREGRFGSWAEVGNRLLISGTEQTARAIAASGLDCRRVEGLANLSEVVVVLSKHHGVASILEGRALVLEHQGPFFVVRPTVPGLNRILGEIDHRLKLVSLANRMIVFRSAAHLPKVAEADPAVEPTVSSIDRTKYEATLKRLIAFKTRYSYSQGIVQAASWSVDLFRSYGYDSKVVTYQKGGRTLPNVVAEVRGSSRPDEIYVVGAHLDSIAFDSNKYAPGADDNASGSAGVLEMARVLSGKKPEATIRFLLFSGEEQGLYGSIAYVQQLQSAGDLSKVKAMLNLDMISYDQAAPLEVMLEGKEISHPFSDRLQANAAAYAPAMQVNRTDNAWGSDHVSFLDEQIPATLTIEFEYEANGNEHSPRDVFEICNLDLAIAILRMDVGTLCELAGVR